MNALARISRSRNATTSIELQQVDDPQLPASDRDAVYRYYIADLILRYASKEGILSNMDAYREIMRVTDRTVGTVKNWIAYRAGSPDMSSLARIVDHWKIPYHELFPTTVTEMLAGISPTQSPKDTSDMSDEHLLISLYSSTDPAKLDRAFAKYTDHPKASLFVRQEGNDMMEEIRPGELMLVDPTIEQVRGGGMYLLKFSTQGEPDRTCVRSVERMVGEPAVRLRCGSLMPESSTEVLPLTQGQLPENITVLGQIVGVLRGT